MKRYKGIDVNAEVHPLLPHMPQVEEYREMLQSLQAVWDNLNLLGQLSGTTAEMGSTREAFAGLTGDLLNNLAERTLAKRVQEMGAKSQVVIDILVRNLFERTADIGFLATDDDIRRFAQSPGDPGELQHRFREYVRKYSVYEDVVLLSPAGEVLARLSSSQGGQRVADGWISQALNTSGAYVEYYGASELFPGRENALIYAYRVTSASGEGLAVLALCFRFADEMTRIFQGLAQADNPAVMALLDDRQQVIASSDPWQLPLGAVLSLPDGAVQRLRFAGRSYLAMAHGTKGYQGYMGPGWRGLVLMPLDQAFSDLVDQEGEAIPEAMLASVMAGGRAFPESLQAIPLKADAIQRDLSRSVWNGTVRQSSSARTVNPAFSKILLWEISRTGARMREVFSRSIGNLQTTVLSSLLADSHFFAALAIDIMDRNLYERANDCRWWALDSTLRRLLSKPAAPGCQEGLEKVLRYINGLYTVYDNLMVYDTQGRVLAVSNPAYAGLVGQVVGEPWVEASLSLNNSQAYTVSPFAATPLYQGRPTYIYAVAVRDMDDRRVVGGVGIVFDSAPQFAAMLYDALPREASGEPVPGAFALFVDGEGRVIASSDERHGPGTDLGLSGEWLAPPAEGLCRLMEFEGQVMAVGAQGSCGYREFKGREDAYRNPVTALIFVPLGDYDAKAVCSASPEEVGVSKINGSHEARPSCEIATFFLGTYWLGLPVSAVAEAIELKGAARLPNAPKQVFGAVLYQGETLPLYNLHAALGVPEPTYEDSTRQVVVVRGEEGRNFGLLVDALGDIPEVAIEDIASVANIYVGVAPVLASVVKMPPGSPMLTLLSVDSISARLVD